MFSSEIRQSRQKDRYRAIANTVENLLARGEFTLTELLCEQEPCRTEGLMALHGHSIESGTVRISPDDAMETPSVRVLVIDPADAPKLYFKELKTRRVPGSNQTVKSWARTPLTGDDTLKHEHAIYVLGKWGYPGREIALSDGTSLAGKVVEVAWLEREVKKADCLDEVKALYERLKPRIEEGRQKNKAAAKAV